jgi:hypothetical protein
LPRPTDYQMIQAGPLEVSQIAIGALGEAGGKLISG